MKTFIIAELGSTHENSLDNALRGIEGAARAGANAVKFQYWSSAKRMEQRRNIRNPAYETYRMSDAWFVPLRDCARAYGVDFQCTVYLPEDVALVDEFVSRHKIATFEANNTPLVDAVLKTEKEVYVSLGCGQPPHPHLSRARSRFWLLHCISAYPTPLDQLNLGVIGVFNRDGFSDHSGDVLTGALAVACGASVLEVHVACPGMRRTNPDAPHSLELDWFREYVRFVRDAERRLGDGDLGPQPCEAPMLDHLVGEHTP